MDTRLTQDVIHAMRGFLTQDQRSEQPVVKAVSIEFWEQLKHRVHHISELENPFVIALAGGSGSGKSHIRNMLVNALGEVSQVTSFTQDNYYRDFEADFPEVSIEAFYDTIDLDDPAHIRFGALIQDLSHLKTLTQGQVMPISQLVYGTPTTKPTILEAGLELKITPFIVTEGIHAFYSEELRALYDFKIFVDLDESTRKQRWLDRNAQENRGATDNMWETTVDCLNQHILPNRAHADLVLNNQAPVEAIQAFIHAMMGLLTEVVEQAA